jgi:hypothetical protein
MMGILLAIHAMPLVGAEITVQVWNVARAPEHEVRKALEDAGWILRQAGTEAQWIRCGNPAVDGRAVSECYPRSEPGLFVFSILPEDPREGLAGDALGFAVLAGRRNGAAAIYSRIVTLLKNNPHYAECNILASVIAHELGHLLSGSAQHADGIMKANWDAADFEAMKQRRLKFSRARARGLATHLSGGGVFASE